MSETNAFCPFHGRNPARTWGSSSVCSCGEGFPVTGQRMTPTEAQRLVTTALKAQADLADYVATYRGVDMLGQSQYRALFTVRDNARDALVAALVGGGS